MGPEERLAAGSRAPLSDGGGEGSGWRGEPPGPGRGPGPGGGPSVGRRSVGLTRRDRGLRGGAWGSRRQGGGKGNFGGCDFGRGIVLRGRGREGERLRGALPDPAPARRSCQIAWAEASLLVNLEFVGSLSLSTFSSARLPVMWMFFQG